MPGLCLDTHGRLIPKQASLAARGPTWMSMCGTGGPGLSGHEETHGKKASGMSWPHLRHKPYPGPQMGRGKAKPEQLRLQTPGQAFLWTL